MNNFEQERKKRISHNKGNIELVRARDLFLAESIKAKYSYNFDWLSRPIIQYPQDIVAVQELIWSIEPDLIIETGIAHGGSLILSASMLALLDLKDKKTNLFPSTEEVKGRQVIGIDIDIRENNRREIEDHFLFEYIELVEGSSDDKSIFEEIKKKAQKYNKVLVFLDSNHTHEHVLAELELWSQLVSVGSYCVVFDTVIQDLSDDFYPDRPWNSSNNPKSAVLKFIESCDNFVIDEEIENKLVLTVAPSGFLKKVSE